MTLESLHLDTGANRVVLDDERERAADGEFGIRCDRIASVTLDGGERSWGEFLTLEDVALIHAWTGELLASRFRR